MSLKGFLVLHFELMVLSGEENGSWLEVVVWDSCLFMNYFVEHY